MEFNGINCAIGKMFVYKYCFKNHSRVVTNAVRNYKQTCCRTRYNGRRLTRESLQITTATTVRYRKQALGKQANILFSQCNITLCRRWGRDKSHQAPLIERCDRDVPRSSPPFLPHSLRCHLHFVSSCRSVRLMRQFVFRPVFGRRHEADEHRKPWDSPDSQT